MAKTIKQVGDRTYRRGGKDVYSETMKDFSKEIIEAIRKDFIRESKTIIIPVK